MSLPTSRVFALALAAVAALSGCGEAAPPGRPNLVLVTVDTLRADRLGAYGSSNHTPTVDRLAREGLTFDDAACPMPVTRPSHFSIFTSRYPREHGVVDNQLALPDEELTLAEVLSAAGYVTGAFTGVVILGEASGAAQGFDTFVAPQGKPIERPAAAVVAAATDWLATLDGTSPYFLWVHVYDPHMPYEPPEAFLPEPARRKPLKRIGWRPLAVYAEKRGGGIGSRVYDQALAYYDGEVEAVDAALAGLVAAIEARGELDSTAVVLTADHGECFENGYFFRHSGCLYDGAARVPLVLRYPPAVVAGERRAGAVELLDVAPTLLAVAGIERPESFAGVDLLAAPTQGVERYALLQHPLSPERAVDRRGQTWAAIERVRGEPMAGVLHGVDRVGLRGAGVKYIVTGKDEELYDLVADPEERHDLAESRPDQLRELRNRVRSLLRDHPLKELDPGHIHPELREHLEALGYL